MLYYLLNTMIGVNKLKNKALTTFMATAITATMVLPMPIASAVSSESSVNHSNFNETLIGGQVAATKQRFQQVKQ